MRTALSGAALIAAMTLTGCGGGAPMTSFDAEKSRIRGALDATYECRESSGGTHTVSCADPNDQMTIELFENEKNEIWIRVIRFAQAPDEPFRKLVGLYGFAGDDFAKCQAVAGKNSYSRLLATHKLTCLIDQYGTWAVGVTQDKAV